MDHLLDLHTVARSLCGVPHRSEAGPVHADLPRPPRRPTSGDPASATDELRTHLVRVLASGSFDHADVALSGGLDSAALAGLARVLGRAPAAWTLDDGFGEEVDRAAAVAEELGLRHEVVSVAADELPEHFESAVAACRSVLWNARAVAKHLFWKRAWAHGARRVMVGAGADELLGDPTPWLGELVEARHAQRQRALALLHPHLRKRVPAVEAWLGLAEAEAPSPGPDPRPGLLRSVAAHETLPPETRAGGAVGVEVLLPYLHPDVVSFALALPSGWRRRDGHDKWLLRAAIEGVLPETVRWQRKTPRVTPAGGGSERARRGWLMLFGALTTAQRIEPLECVVPASARQLFEQHAASRPGEAGYATREAVLMRLASVIVLSETAAR